MALIHECESRYEGGMQLSPSLSASPVTQEHKCAVTQ